MHALACTHKWSMVVKCSGVMNNGDGHVEDNQISKWVPACPTCHPPLPNLFERREAEQNPHLLEISMLFAPFI